MNDEVLFAESVIEQLTALSAAAHPYETGGILLGVLSEGRPWVIDARHIAARRPQENRYEIPRGSTVGLVREAKALDARIGYLGDWHSHPANVGPSETDLATYRELVNRAELLLEPRPLLVVMRQVADTWALDVTRGRFARLLPPLVVTLTGQPSAGPPAGEVD